MIRWTLTRLAMAAGMAAVLAAPPTMALHVDGPLIFGSSETRSDDLRPFAKWTGVLERISRDPQPAPNSCIREPNGSDCRVESWQTFLADFAGKTRFEQVVAVNAYMNQHDYIEDMTNYGVDDYWATPREFFDRNGDCEDYAIAKYVSLRQLGFMASQLRIVVLEDENLKIAHAVLITYLDGEALLLDNQIKGVVTVDTMKHYRPLFSLNEVSYWLHKRAAPQIALDKLPTQPSANGSADSPMATNSQ